MKRAALVLTLLLPAAALGYVLSGPAVLRKMAARRDELQLSSMIVRGSFQLSGEQAKLALAALGQPTSDQATLPATFTYKMPGRCRLELDGKAGGEAPAASFVNGSVKTVGGEVPVLKLLAADLCPLLVEKSEAGLERFAREAGIDSSKVSLGRVGNLVSYVVGARAHEAGTVSLWVEKEHFWPLRVAFKPEAPFTEMKMTDYNSAASGEWHPRILEVRKGEELVARFTLEKVEPNTKIPDAIF